MANTVTDYVVSLSKCKCDNEFDPCAYCEAFYEREFNKWVIDQCTPRLELNRTVSVPVLFLTGIWDDDIFVILL